MFPAAKVETLSEFRSLSHHQKLVCYHLLSGAHGNPVGLLCIDDAILESRQISPHDVALVAEALHWPYHRDRKILVIPQIPADFPFRNRNEFAGKARDAVVNAMLTLGTRKADHPFLQQWHDAVLPHLSQEYAATLQGCLDPTRRKAPSNQLGKQLGFQPKTNRVESVPPVVGPSGVQVVGPSGIPPLERTPLSLSPEARERDLAAVSERSPIGEPALDTSPQALIRSAYVDLLLENLRKRRFPRHAKLVHEPAKRQDTLIRLAKALGAQQREDPAWLQFVVTIDALVDVLANPEDSSNGEEFDKICDLLARYPDYFEPEVEGIRRYHQLRRVLQLEDTSEPTGNDPEDDDER